jgi:glycosyltransferase involved in cell wall biosynthesis
VPPEDAAALAATLDELAADPALRRRMGEASHARVRSTFRADEMVERTLEVYAALVEPRA